MDAEALAARLGCTVATLKVHATTHQFAHTQMFWLHQQAEAIGVDEAQLASDLLEVIGQESVGGGNGHGDCSAEMSASDLKRTSPVAAGSLI